MSNYSSSSGWGADWLVGVVKKKPRGVAVTGGRMRPAAP